MTHYNPTITEYFPDKYMPVKVQTKNRKDVGVGVLNPSNKIHTLYLFTETDGVIIYTQNEIKQALVLLDPVDGKEWKIGNVLC